MLQRALLCSLCLVTLGERLPASCYIDMTPAGLEADIGDVSSQAPDKIKEKLRKLSAMKCSMKEFQRQKVAELFLSTLDSMNELTPDDVDDMSVLLFQHSYVLYKLYLVYFNYVLILCNDYVFYF